MVGVQRGLGRVSELFKEDERVLVLLDGLTEVDLAAFDPEPAFAEVLMADHLLELVEGQQGVGLEDNRGVDLGEIRASLVVINRRGGFVLGLGPATASARAGLGAWPVLHHGLSDKGGDVTDNKGKDINNDVLRVDPAELRADLGVIVQLGPLGSH